jgi:hypothetical protein
MEPYCIAVDAGGVLVYTTTSGDETEVSRKPIEGAKEGLIALKKLGFKICLVSFAGRKTASLNTLDMEEFYSGLIGKQYYVKNKLEKLAICRSIGAVALIDDNLDILNALHTGLYHRKPKEIKGLKTIAGILFVGDINVTGDKIIENVENVINFPVAKDWNEVVELCEILHKKLSDKSIELNTPDSTIDINKYVYTDLCVPPIVSSISKTK